MSLRHRKANIEATRADARTSSFAGHQRAHAIARAREPIVVALARLDDNGRSPATIAEMRWGKTNPTLVAIMKVNEVPGGGRTRANGAPSSSRRTTATLATSSSTCIRKRCSTDCRCARFRPTSRSRDRTGRRRATGSPRMPSTKHPARFRISVAHHIVRPRHFLRT
jgi:hypothetical protein